MAYDVIVIGGGSAGATLATRLSEASQRSVLLLEAGPDYPDFERLPEGEQADTLRQTAFSNWYSEEKSAATIERATDLPIP